MVTPAAEISPPTSLPARRSLSGERALLAAVFFVGAVLRLLPVLRADFPLGDGGMFYVMARDLERNGFRLPAYTTYNGAGIPFAYPPLGFYLAALVDRMTPLSLLDAVRLLPPIFSVLTIVAFYRLARTILGPGLPAVLATGCFAVFARSYGWEIVGGGLTRSPGFFFAVLAIEQIFMLYREGGWRRVALSSLFASLAVLSHLETALFVALSALLFFLAYGRNRQGVRDSLLVAVGVLALSAPWWATVLAQHGLAPFRAALGAGQPPWVGLVNLLFLNISQELSFPGIRALSMVGLAVCLYRRRWLLPAWLVLIFLGDSRKALTLASVPIALLASIALSEVLHPFLQRALPAERWRNVLYLGLGAYAGFYLILSNTLAIQLLTQPLSAQERLAMEWIASHTPPGASFLVMTEDDAALDRSREWLPALTGRISLNTVQGTEWFPTFWQHIDAATVLQACNADDGTCLEHWAAQYHRSFAYVYIVKRPALRVNISGVYAQLPDPQSDCCAALRHALQHDPQYRVIFDNTAVTIFERLPDHAQARAATERERS
ncbi:ArnT family glycosyltransferase [Thermorudis peleae]|uniref:ArnT family glycosyltransferase n=1 Tax=Thermorudis peleae TaxID=1382356 RepID=UPI00056E3F4B|nr:glycosyltransferase family 39 protein [Thermorudis peleae]